MSGYQINFEVGPLRYEIVSDCPFQMVEQYAAYFHEPHLMERQMSFWGNEETNTSFYNQLDGGMLPTIHCEVKKVSNFSAICGDCIYQNPERMIFINGEREHRLYGNEGEVYAIVSELAENHLHIEWKMDENNLVLGPWFLEMLAMERFLLKANGLILHSSYIAWHHTGILFTAPSGTGKSTQASLWEKYADAEIINGDRSIMIQNPLNHQFYVCGLPFCGSSGINKNVCIPLRAIVFLEQGPENIVKSCPPAYASSHLFGEMSINQWNPDFVVKSLHLIEELMKKVQLIQLTCTPEPDAVSALQNYFIEKNRLASE